jgi:CRISPR-associated protein Cas5d
MKMYEVQMEIAGPAAMFMRPDTGAAPISYPAPTFSAAKGIFESIARLKSATIRPLKVEICKPIQFHKYTTNYGGPLRKDDQIKKKASYQLVATILIDVHYRLYGIVEAVSNSPNNTNHLHALQEIFQRRLNSGQCFVTPCLGWKEFTPSYVGPIREKDTDDNIIEAQTSINQTLPSMLHTVFSSLSEGKHAPYYRQNVKITNGVLFYEPDEREELRAK